MLAEEICQRGWVGEICGKVVVEEEHPEEDLERKRAKLTSSRVSRGA